MITMRSTFGRFDKYKKSEAEGDRLRWGLGAFGDLKLVSEKVLWQTIGVAAASGTDGSHEHFCHNQVGERCTSPIDDGRCRALNQTNRYVESQHNRTRSLKLKISKR
jgi:hypothetical protein